MQSRIALRTFLIGALLLVLLPIIMASGWFFYRSAFQATEQFAQQLAGEVSGRIREKVVAFFDVPQRVVAFNVEQARAGYLMHRNPEELMRQFLLQIRQQPQLSFVSMGMVDGEVEQNLEVCTQLADRHYIIEQGSIVYSASNADFLADVAVKDRYLGVGLV